MHAFPERAQNSSAHGGSHCSVVSGLLHLWEETSTKPYLNYSTTPNCLVLCAQEKVLHAHADLQIHNWIEKIHHAAAGWSTWAQLPQAVPVIGSRLHVSTIRALLYPAVATENRFGFMKNL